MIFLNKSFLARAALAAVLIASLAVAVSVGGSSNAIAQDVATPAERTINVREALRSYAKTRGQPLLADDSTLSSLGTTNLVGGPAQGESLDDLVPALLYQKRLAVIDIGGVLHLLPIAQAINHTPIVGDEGLETAGDYDWVTYTLILRGIDANVVRTALAPFLTREASVTPVSMNRPGMSGMGNGAMLICDRAGNVRRVRELVNSLNAAAQVAPDVVTVDLPEGLESDDVVRVFLRSGGVHGELINDGRRFVGTTEPGMAEVKRETLVRLAAAMNK